MPRDVVLVGTGAITALRHLPAVGRVRGARVLGVVGTDAEQVDLLARRARAPHRAVMAVGVPGGAPGDAPGEELPGWITGADLAVVGTPPHTHTAVARALTTAGVPTIVEKPLLVAPEERAEWERMAAGPTPVGVMHNFRHSRGFRRVARWIADGRIGEVTGVQCLQWSSASRRLPAWYRELPLGLFWDEAAHFLYLSRHLAGPLELTAAHAVPSPDPAETTPRALDLQLVGRRGHGSSGGAEVPVTVAMRFGTAISEWGLVVAGTRGTIVHDMYRDVPLLLPDDGPHRAPQIVRTSLVATVQHWLGTIDNGVRILAGRQLYGVDTVIERMLESTAGAASSAHAAGTVPEGLRVEDGLSVTDLMRTVVDRVGA